MDQNLISNTFSAVSIKGYGITFGIFTSNNDPIFTVNTITEKAILMGGMDITGDLNVDGVLSFGSLAPGLNIPAKVGNSRVLEVSDVSEYPNIGAALAAANALVPPPSNASGVVIRIYPGLYIENNPLIIPEGVVIIGKAGRAPFVQVVPINPDVVFDVVGDCTFKNIMIIGNEAATIGIRSQLPGITTTVDRVVVTGCNTGYLFSGAGSLINALTCAAVSSPGQSVDIGMNVKGNILANMHIANTMAAPNPVPFTYGILIEDAGTEVFLATSRFSGNVTGVNVRNGASLDALSSEFRDCDIGVCVETSGRVSINSGVFCQQ